LAREDNGASPEPPADAEAAAADVSAQTPPEESSAA